MFKSIALLILASGGVDSNPARATVLQANATESHATFTERAAPTIVTAVVETEILGSGTARVLATNVKGLAGAEFPAVWGTVDGKDAIVLNGNIFLVDGAPGVTVELTGAGNAFVTVGPNEAFLVLE